MKIRLTTVAILAVCVAVRPASSAESGTSTSKPAKKIAVIPVRDELGESPGGMAFAFTGEMRGTLREQIRRIDKAGKDKDIAGVVLLLEEPSVGWAQAQELRSSIQRVRELGKPVYCHLASCGASGYLVAAACDRVSMIPTGELYVVGIAAEAIYLKGLLDKIGVKAEMEHCGAYKGAAEPFTRTGPSDEAKEQMNRLLGDLYEQMVETIAKSRSLRPEEVRRHIDAGPLHARQAAAARFVDDLRYRHEFLADARKRHDGAELAKGYGRKKGPEVDFGSPFGMFKLFQELMKPGAKKAKNVIALVYVDGMIVTGRSTQTLFGEGIVGSSTLRAALIQAANDKHVKAVVLRVHSPGGSALASDIIHEATQVVKDSGKPLIVSMGDVAASGGYYVSAGADAIFAEPGTLTGSIGVVGGKIALGGLFDWAGITTHTYKFGKNADLFNMTRPFDERERKVVRRLMKDVYEQFKRCVVNGRGDRLAGDIDDLAGGRVYTGRQAVEKGLVDALGGLHEAIADAADRAKIKNYEIRLMPPPKTLFDYISEAFGFADEEEIREDARLDLGPLLASRDDIGTMLRTARHFAPDQVACLVRLLLRVELLRRESVLLVTPNEWVLR